VLLLVSESMEVVNYDSTKSAKRWELLDDLKVGLFAPRQE